ncbi:basic-leucine zipper transcription factor protein [Stemphylium lycopersici]|nr:basic-leucine zipper transcription factor protein [Stemphylium lycopersici]
MPYARVFAEPHMPRKHYESCLLSHIQSSPTVDPAANLMDSQSFDYWMAQGNYIAPSHQTTVFDMPPDLAKVPSLSGSPISSTYDQFPAQMQQAYFPHIVDETMQFGSYPMPMTPSDFGSDHDSPYCSPRPLQHVEPSFATGHTPVQSERTHTTSGRRRAQNRAAQRAFRERKEKHARDLEAQLFILNEKYNKLEVSHAELNSAYEKLRKTIELLTQDDDAEGEETDGTSTRRHSSNSDTLRKLLDILHGEFKSINPVKIESSS